MKQLGRFQIKSRLGAGAFGEVFRAHDPQLDRDIALKVPHAAVLQNAKVAKRFLIEARATARLTHPNIVPVFDAGQDAGHHYIASAFIEGKTLDDALTETFDFRKAARIVMKLAGALAYAHEQGIVHRDIKPANIMLDEKGEPHLMDFGLARLETGTENLTHDGAILGTPAYMPPEQAAGDLEKVSAASDQYSLGVTLYEILCGERPFSGPPEIVIFNVINQEPPSPRSIKESIPRDLETICMKAMAKEQSARYENGNALAEDLRRWLDDEPIRARRLSWAERTTRWCRRNPVVAGLDAAVVAVFLVGFSLTTWQWQVANDERNKAIDAGIRERKTAGRERKTANRERKTAGLERKATKKARDATEREKQARSLADATVAQAYFDRGLTLCQENNIHEGVHWMARGLNVLPNNNHELDQVIRLNLASWANKLYKLKEMRTWKHMLAVSPGVESVLIQSQTGDGRKLKLLDVRTGEQLGIFRTRNVRGPSSSTISANNQFVILRQSARPGLMSDKFEVWDAVNGKLILENDEDTASHGGVVALSFSPDSRVVAILREDGSAQVWETETGKPVGEPIPGFEFQPQKSRPVFNALRPVFRTLKFSGDGGVLLLAHQADTKSSKPDPMATVRTFDTSTGEQIGTFEAFGARVNAGSLSPDGQSVLLGMSHHANRTGVEFVDARTGQSRDLVIAEGQPNTVVAGFSHNGRKVAIQRNSFVNIWSFFADKDGLTGLRGRRLSGPIPHDLSNRLLPAFSNDDGLLLTWNKIDEVQLWNVATGQVASSPLRHAGHVIRATFGKNNRHVYCIEKSHRTLSSLRHWEMGESDDIVLKDFDSTYDFTGKGFDLDDFNIGRDQWQQFRLRDDGRTLVVVRQHYLRRRGSRVLHSPLRGVSVCKWDIQTGELIMKTKNLGEPHQEFVKQLLSPNGETVLITSYERSDAPDSQIVADTGQLWNIDRAEPVGESFRIPRYRVFIRLKQSFGEYTKGWRYSFSPDGSEFVSVERSFDNDTIRPIRRTTLWNTKTGERVNHNGDYSHTKIADTIPVAVSPDGRFRVEVVGERDEFTRLVDTRTGKTVSIDMPHSFKVHEWQFCASLPLLVTRSGGTFSLWHVPSGVAIGRPYRWSTKTHDLVTDILLGPNGKVLHLGDRSVRLPIPTTGAPAQVRAWVESITGLKLDESGALHVLDEAGWRERKPQIDGNPKSTAAEKPPSVQSRDDRSKAISQGEPVNKADPKAVQDELKRLAGTWKNVSVEERGKQLPANQVARMELTIKGNQYLNKEVRSGHVFARTLTIDPQANPKTIDMTITGGGDGSRDVTYRGIYELDGDTLKIYSVPDFTRPTGFQDKSSSGTLVIRKRVKK
ncbi:MAG: protein kinase [Planctomycetaceae bacterium]|nr:protein kinase [Planctomycetaceae bacterium]